MYALIVKNSENMWQVWQTLPNIPFPEREQRLQDAIKSEFPIVGKNVTEHKAFAKSGAVWDGEKFSGGEIGKIRVMSGQVFEGTIEDAPLSVYAYICNNVIVLLQFGDTGTYLDEQLQAIFESETTVINVPEGQKAEAGDIWDGTNIIKRFGEEVNE
jgi:hypothetical protein